MHEEKTLEQKVLKVLEIHPVARNSDLALTSLLWKIYYPKYILQITLDNTQNLHNAILLSSLQHLPSFDTISRCRRLIQSKGQFVPTDWTIAKGRKMNEEVWRNAMAKDPVATSIFDRNLNEERSELVTEIAQKVNCDQCTCNDVNITSENEVPSFPRQLSETYAFPNVSPAKARFRFMINEMTPDEAFDKLVQVPDMRNYMLVDLGRDYPNFDNTIISEDILRKYVLESYPLTAEESQKSES
jgi:hypothetical protein